MKFEDLLMQPSDQEKQKIEDLEKEVEKLEEELDAEMKLKKILQCALEGPVHSCSCISKLLPPKVQVLLAELAMVEEEIIWLEGKVDELKLTLYQERKLSKDWELLTTRLGQGTRHWHQKQLQCGSVNEMEVSCRVVSSSRSQNFDKHSKYKRLRRRRASFSSSVDIPGLSSKNSNGNANRAETSMHARRNQNCDAQVDPNELSEDLMKCLIGIFLQLNQASLGSKGSAIVPKHPLSCMNSKGFISKTAFNCKAPIFSLDNTSNIDPYGILPDFDGTIRDVGPYKNFIHITRSSHDTGNISDCFKAMGHGFDAKTLQCGPHFIILQAKVSFLDQHIQCLHNACTAFLQHGLPSTEEKLLALLNKAAMNVGGIILNALAIEHFILRYPSDKTQGPTDEKEMILRQAYGLGYPEPNVTFALCRGSRSSPALRVYTPDNVVNELGRAKVEYLEASVGVTSKKKIVVPKLLQWHMRDFADDMKSLLEWTYSQLPHSGSLKRLIMECLIGEAKSPIEKMVEIQPYDSEFRYLLPL